MGWSTVVVCLYWAAVVLGSLAPVLHYLLLTLNPALLLVRVLSRNLALRYCSLLPPYLFHCLLNVLVKSPVSCIKKMF